MKNEPPNTALRWLFIPAMLIVAMLGPISSQALGWEGHRRPEPDGQSRFPASPAGQAPLPSFGGG